MSENERILAGDMRDRALDLVAAMQDESITPEVANIMYQAATYLRKCAWDHERAQPASVGDGFYFAAHLQRQRDWSGKTFGPGARAQGVVDHIRKELREIEADPGDLKEWIDVVILALDGAWRSGAQPKEIIAALVAKQTKNEGRVWPDWRMADPNKAIEHDRSHDAAAPQPAKDGA